MPATKHPAVSVLAAIRNCDQKFVAEILVFSEDLPQFTKCNFELVYPGLVRRAFLLLLVVMKISAQSDQVWPGAAIAVVVEGERECLKKLGIEQINDLWREYHVNVDGMSIAGRGQDSQFDIWEQREVRNSTLVLKSF